MSQRSNQKDVKSVARLKHSKARKKDLFNLSSLKKYKWTSAKEMVFLKCMARLKPVGLYKHLNVLLIREMMCKELNENVPTMAIWEYMNHFYNMDMADKIESEDMKIENENFALPQNEEWTQLIKEQNPN